MAVLGALSLLNGKTVGFFSFISVGASPFILAFIAGRFSSFWGINTDLVTEGESGIKNAFLQSDEFIQSIWKWGESNKGYLLDKLIWGWVSIWGMFFAVALYEPIKYLLLCMMIVYSIASIFFMILYMNKDTTEWREDILQRMSFPPWAFLFGLITEKLRNYGAYALMLFLMFPVLFCYAMWSDL